MKTTEKTIKKTTDTMLKYNHLPIRKPLYLACIMVMLGTVNNAYAQNYIGGGGGGGAAALTSGGGGSSDTRDGYGAGGHGGGSLVNVTMIGQ